MRCRFALVAAIGLLTAMAISGALAADGANATSRGTYGRIVFIHGPDVFTMNPDGTDVRQLTSLGPDNGAFFASWSRDGRQLVFNEFPSNATPQFWIMNADGTNQHLLLGDPSFFDFAPNFSPDGSRVIFTRCQLGGNCALYRVNVD